MTSILESVSEFIGIPFRHRGRDMDGCDCWGLVRLVYRRLYGIELADFADRYENALDAPAIAGLVGEESRSQEWAAVETPQPGDVVLLRIAGAPVHVGVMVEQDRMLHVLEGIDAAIERLDSPLWQPRVAGYFRHRLLANPPVPVSSKISRLLPGAVTHLAVEGTSVAALARRFDASADTHYIFIDDVLVEDWEAVRLEAGSIVTVGRRIHGGGRSGGGKDVTRVVATIAVMAAALAATVFTAGAAAPTLGTGMAQFLGGMAGMAVAMAGNLLINTLIPPPTPKKPQISYDIRAMRNRVDPYGAVTRVFGKHRIYPKYAAMPYTELVGTNEQYLRCLFLIGKGRYDLSAFKIGDTAISGFEGVEIEKYYTGDSTYYRLFPNDVYEEPLSIELQPNVYQTRTSALDAQELTVEITFPAGLYRISSGGNRRPTICEFSIEYSPYGQSQWRNLANHVQLNLSGTPSTNIAVGQTATTASGSGTVRYVHQTTVHNATGGSDNDGRPIFNLVTYTDYVIVEVSSGSFSAGQTATFGGSYTAVIASVAASSTLIREENGASFKKSFTIKVPTGRYDVRVRRLTANEGGATRTAYWTALRSVKFATPVSQPGLTLVGLKIKATSQLNGVLDQFNCVAESLLQAYDGSQWRLVKTRNPAWAFVEVLCGSSNKRPVSTSRLNIAAIRTWALRCEANSWNFDAVVDSFTTVWDLLRKIAAVGRATPGMTDNKYTVIEDVPRTTPIQHFSPRNTWGFSGSRIFPDIPHGLRVRFFNEQKDYQEDERVVFDDGYNEANATLYETIDFYGVTHPSHVWKLGRYHIACLRLRPETYQFNVDVEHLVATRGDLVRITHDVMLVGLGQGRIKSISTTSVSIDDAVTMETGKTYGFQFRRSDGSMRSCTITTSAGTHPPGTVFTISPAMNPADLPAVGDLAFFGQSGSESILALITRIDPGVDLTARVTCIPYNSAVYNADQGTIPSWNSQITLPPPENRPPPTPRILYANHNYRTQNLNEDGTYELYMSVGFDVQDSGFARVGTLAKEFWPTDVIQGFQAQYRETADGVTTSWTSLPELGREERSFEFKIKNSTTYDIRVRSFSTPGMYSEWSVLAGVSVSWTAAYPPNVTGLQSAEGGTSFSSVDLEVIWTAVPGGGSTGPLVYDYRVEVRTSDGSNLLRTEYVTQNRYSYDFDKNIKDGGPRASVQIRVWARNRFGVISQTAAQATFSNPAPATPTGLGNQPIMGGVHFYWTGSNEKDFKHFQYRTKVTAGGAWSSWQPISGTSFTRMLTPSEKSSHGANAAIYIEVLQTDMFGQNSSAAASNANAGSLNIASTDITNFAVTASKIYTRIPIVDGLTLTNNSPSAGYVAWNAHKIYYNGVEYSISAGNSNLKYIYWYNLAASLGATNTHPADGGVSGWTPGRDFIIAVNISGTGQQAWNAIANQVIGSAYIMNAAINDAHVNSLSGTKISASSSVAIGGTTYGSDGIQLQYNSGNPRFYAGDGSQQYVKFDGSTLEVSGNILIKSGSSGYTNISDRPTSLSAINSSEGSKLAGIQTGATRNIITRSASSSPPSSPAAGDIWHQTDTAITYRYSGSSWEIIANAYTNTNQLTDGAGLGTTAQWNSVSGRPADSDIYNEYAYRPPNLCFNAAFEGWPSNNVGIGWGYHAYNITCTYGSNRNATYTLPFDAGGGTTPWMYQSGTANNQNYYAYFYSSKIPVVAGKRYCVSAYIGVHRCTGFVLVNFYDSSDSFLSSSSWSDSTARNENAKTGGNRLDLFKRCYAFATAPTGTAYARIYILKFDTYAGQTDSYMHCALVALQEVGENQTTPPPWGPSNTSILDGGYIRSEVLTATRIITGTLNGTYVNVTNLSASNITAGTLNVDRISNSSLNYIKLAVGAATDLAAGNTSSSGVSAYVTCAGNDKVLLIGTVSGPLGGSNYYCDSEGSCFNIIYSSTGTIYLRRGNQSGTILTSRTVTGFGYTATTGIVTYVDTPGVSEGTQQYYSTTSNYGTASTISIACCRR